MSTTEEEIQARKAKSLEKFNMYRQREQDIKDGRRYAVERGLPILAAFPSEANFGIYIMFKPVDSAILKVAFAVRSRRDMESMKKVRGILGHRIKTNDSDTVILLKAANIHHTTFLAKDGDWSFVRLYDAFGFIVLDEVLRWQFCPEWLSRRLKNVSRLDFMDQRLIWHLDEGCPPRTIRTLQRYYEQMWPKPPGRVA
jgi:hypothetical protein